MREPKEIETQNPSSNFEQKADSFFHGFGLTSRSKLENRSKKMHTIPLLSPHKGGTEEILPKIDIRKEFLNLIDTADESLLERAFKAAKKIIDGAMLTKAPLLWRDRDRSRKLKCTEFVLETYKPWIGKGLRRHHLKEIDPQLYQTLGTFYSRNGIPPELESLEVIDEKITDEFLKKHGINEPKDALRVFKDDPREAKRIYSAAQRKLKM